MMVPAIESKSIRQYTIRPEARKREPLPSGEVIVRPPKPLPSPPDKPSVGAILSRTVAPMVAVAAMFFVFGSGNSQSLFFVVPTLATGLVTGGFQFWSYYTAVKQYDADLIQRKQAYRRYLAEMRRKLEKIAAQQSHIQEEENPSAGEMIRRAERRRHTLWERVATDDDFLALRLGQYTAPLCLSLELPELNDEDPLKENVERLHNEYTRVPDLPLTINLRDLRTIGLSDSRQDSALRETYTLLTHLVTHHSPDVVQLYIFSHHPQAAQRWAWTRWLPHTDTLHGRTSHISLHPDTDDELLSPLADLLRQRLDRNHAPARLYGQPEPHIVIVFDTAPNLWRHQVVNMLLAHHPGWQESDLQACAIFINNIPPQVNAQIELNGKSLKYREGSQRIISGQAELTTGKQVAALARHMAPLRTIMAPDTAVGSLPRNVRLVELLGATQPQEVDLEELYGNGYDPQRVMAFPIGLNEELKPERIILREDGQGGYGHHAMLAGATGKGKSVTLQSIVLSLAANTAPAYLNVVLADFKGGASELALLRKLPHVVGFVTDLAEPAHVERFRLALVGEVLRRKRIFDDAPHTIGRRIQNIYDYNKASPDNPLPHLLVVIDEFAKGLQINPDFKTTMDKDIVAQGRALGIHLILSTQKAIDFMAVRQNMEVRMSMQLQTTEDSRAIFNRDDAAKKLTRAWQAFLQVGDNQIFEMFQVARADIPYKPEKAGNLDLLEDFTIYLVLPDGRRQPLYQHRPPSQEQLAKSASHQLPEAAVLVDHIYRYCQDKYPDTRSLCLPPLPEADKLPLLDLLRDTPVYCLWDGTGWDGAQIQPERRLQIPLGRLDLPLQQEQRPYLLNLNQGDGHFIVTGAAGSGKGLALRSLVLGLAAAHSPDDLLFFLVGHSPTLAIFAELSHCQAMIQPDETERVSRLFTFLQQETRERAERMSDTQTDTMEGLRAACPELPLPSLVVVFDDFAGFMSDHPQFSQTMTQLIRAGKQTDIHIVFSVTAFRGSHTKVLTNTLNRLALGVRRGGDTLEILGQRAKPLPDKPGRGYVLADQSILECQIAAPSRRTGVALASPDATVEIRSWVAEMKHSWTWANGRSPLPLITVLPRHLPLETLWQTWPAPSGSLASLPTAALGLDYDSLSPVMLDYSRLPAYNLVIGPPRSGKTEFLLTLGLATAVNIPPDRIEIFIFSLKPQSPLQMLRYLPHVQFAGNVSRARKLLQKIQSSLAERLGRLQIHEDQTLATLVDVATAIPKQTIIFIDDARQFSHFDELNPLLDDCMAFSQRLGVHLFLADTTAQINQLKQNFSLKYMQQVSRYGSGVAFSTDPNDLSLLNQVGKLSNAVLKFHQPQMGHGRGLLAYDNQLQVVQFARAGEETADTMQFNESVRQLVQEINGRYPQPDEEAED